MTEQKNENKKTFKEKANEWWLEHRQEVILGAIGVGVAIGGVFALKAAGEHALDRYHENALNDLGELTGTDPKTIEGGFVEKAQELTERLWEKKDLESFDDSIKERLIDLHKACNDKGIELSLAAYLGGGDDNIRYTELEYYTKHGCNINRP